MKPCFLILLTFFLFGCAERITDMRKSSSSTAAVLSCVPEKPTYTDHIKPVINQSCVSCHADFSKYQIASPPELLGAWEEVAFRITAGTMPPKSAPAIQHGCFKEVIEKWVKNGIPENLSDYTSPPPDPCIGDNSLSAFPMRRLTNKNTPNTLTTLFGTAVINQVPQVLSLMQDSPGYSDPAVDYFFINDAFTIATKLAGVISMNPSLLGSQYACMSQTTVPNTCVDTFITSIGYRTFRRPLSSAEITSFRDLYRSNPMPPGDPAPTSKEALEMLVKALVQSPHFLYRVELGADTADPNVFTLNAFELASRLSYLLLNDMPDMELFQAASNGLLLSENGFSDQVKRIVAKVQARESSATFFSKWLQVDSTQTITPSYTPAFLNGIDPIKVKTEMRDEIIVFLKTIWAANSGFSGAINSNWAAVPGASLAAVYGINPSPDVALPPTQRAGLLTRVWRHYNGQDLKSLVHVGAKILEDIFCYTPEPPPQDLVDQGLTNPPPPDPTKTRREQIEALTSQPKCIGCHGVINAPGYAFENYDSLGRYRTMENGKPINAKAFVHVFGKEINGPLEFSKETAISPKAHQCFAKNVFQYAAGKKEESTDACYIQGISKAVSNESFQGVFTRLTTDPRFKVRKRLP